MVASTPRARASSTMRSVVDRAAPVRLADHLVMRDLRRQAALLADRNRLAHALDQALRFVAHVRDVDAAHLAGDSRQLDDFFGRRERARARKTARSSGRSAPSSMPCRTSARIFSISSRVAARSTSPITSLRTEPCPMKIAKFGVMRVAAIFARNGAERNRRAAIRAFDQASSRPAARSCPRSAPRKCRGGRACECR